MSNICSNVSIWICQDMPYLPGKSGSWEPRKLPESHDCERNAAKRFIIKLRQDHPHLKFIVTEDSLSSNAPHIETMQNHALHYILGVKEGDHGFLFQQVQEAEHAGRVTYYERHDRAAGVSHRFR